LKPLIDYEAAEAREQFFAAIGRCVSLYQTLEDQLETVFERALGAEPERAAAVWSTVRGLKARLEVIDRLLQTRGDPYLARDWDGLSRAMVAAAKARNQIVHARPAGEAGRLELHKARHDADAAVWTTERMIVQRERWAALLDEVRGFAEKMG
jgi:hypothetical protein